MSAQAVSLVGTHVQNLAVVWLVLVLTGSPADAWPATWSLADGVVARPLDAVKVQEAVAHLLAPATAGTASCATSVPTKGRRCPPAFWSR